MASVASRKEISSSPAIANIDEQLDEVVMSIPKPKNTVRISFTVIDENGKETLSRDYFLPFEQITRARFPVLPEVAQAEAKKFHEAAVMMGCFGE